MDTNTNPTAGEAEGTLSPEGRELLAIICREMPRAIYGPRKIRTVSAPSRPAPKGYHWRPAGHVRLGSTVAFLNHAGHHDPAHDQQVVRVSQDKADADGLVFTFPEVKVPSRENPGQQIRVASKFRRKFHRDERVLVKS